MVPFVPFGADHVCALAAVAVFAAGAALAVRRLGRAGALGIRWALAAAIVVALGAEIGRGAVEGWLTLEAVAPLQLCDAALLLAVVCLRWPRRWMVEVLYFWTFGATSAAMAFPDLAVGFPRWEFVVFFGLHGLGIVAAAALVFGMGLTPRRASALRVFAVTNAYAIVVGLVNVAWGTNYLYLCSKPVNPTLLDRFGPWPLYVVVVDALALGVFWLLELPFRWVSDRTPDAPPSP